MLALLAAPVARAQERPNVVVFLTDDQTVRSVRYMPNVQRLLKQRGASFSRNFATYPLCCPSRATLMTGQYAHNHRVLHNAGRYGGYKRLDNSNSLPVWLQLAGYRTLQVGRWLNGYGTENADPTELLPGWSEWFVPVGTSAQSFQGQTINENGLLRFFTQYQTELYADKAIELIRESPDPFFLNLTFSGPHAGRPRDADDPGIIGTPSPAPRHRDLYANVELPRPPSFDELDVRDKPQDVFERPPLGAEMVAAIRENWQQELESLQSVDEAIGRIVEELRSSGRLGDTLIVFTSDNGFMHGEHRLPVEKVWPYEESTRVPLILRGPGVPAGLQLGQLTGNIDVVPTILDATGALPTVAQDGRSLFGLLEDPTREWGREIMLESGFGANGVGGYAGVRNYRFLYVEWSHSGEYELYDLSRDPWQLRNLDGKVKYERAEAELARRLGVLRGCAGGGCSRRPALTLRTRIVRAKRGARRAARCPSVSVALRVGGPEQAKVDRVDFFSGRRRLGSDRRAPFELALSPARRERRVRARVTDRYGRLLTLDRRVSPCV